MQKKTAKIKSIGEIRKWTNPQNQKDIFYHSLTMDNGDLISLGKIKEGVFIVGQEITYIEEEGRDGRKKRKEERKPFTRGGGITNSQVAVLGACIIKASSPDQQLSDIVGKLLAELERVS